MIRALLSVVAALWQRQRCPICDSRVGDHVAEHVANDHTHAEIDAYLARRRMESHR